MYKTNFTFSSYTANRFYFLRRIIKRVIFTRPQLYLHQLKVQQGYALSALLKKMLKSGAILCLATAIHYKSHAQCNTFRNADAANPLLKVLDLTKKVAGFAFADIDGDGDQDLYISYDNKTYPPKPSPLHFFRNIGSKIHPVFKEDSNTGFSNMKAGYKNPFMQFVDIDGDGDLDYYASEDAQGYYDFGSITFYENIGTPAKPKFRPGGNDPLPFISSHVFQPFAFADIDGDGDYDLYACDVSAGYGFGYFHRVYYNTGTKKQGVFDIDNYVPNTIDGNLNRTYYDWNKDGLLDFFGVNYSSYNKYIKNIGPQHKPQYVDATAEGPVFKNGSPYRIIDLNNDGAPEVFDFSAHYSTLSPVAVIEDTVINKGGKSYTILSSKNRGAGYAFRWEYNGKTIAGADKAFIVAEWAGLYTLYVTNECGTGVSLNYELKENNTLKESDDNLLAIGKTAAPAAVIRQYPNPFTDYITVEFPADDAENHTLIITDMQGKTVYTKTTSDRTVRTGDPLLPGTYVLQVWKHNKMIYHKLIVKQ